MCFFAFFLVGVYCYNIYATSMWVRLRQRSRIWILWALIPVVGYVSTIALCCLKPLGGCKKCGQKLEAWRLTCPDCGWDLKKEPYEEAPLLPGQFRIPFWLGQMLMGVCLLFLGTFVYFLFWRPYWEPWGRWEYHVVQARLIEDTEVLKALGHPLRFGWPALKVRERKDSHWGSMVFTLSGPRGKADVRAEYETCRIHGWHFPRLGMQMQHGGKRLDLSDNHPEGRKAPPRWGSLAAPDDEGGEARNITMARLVRDPVLLAQMGGPLIFLGGPRLKADGIGNWSLEAPLQGTLGNAVVTGLLLKNDNSIGFARLELHREGQNEPVSLQDGPGFPKLPPGSEETIFRVGSTLAAYVTDNAVEVGLSTVIFLIFGGVSGWAWILIQRKELEGAGEDMNMEEEAQAAISQLQPSDREALFKELARGRMNTAFGILKQAIPALSPFEGERILLALLRAGRSGH